MMAPNQPNRTLAMQSSFNGPRLSIRNYGIKELTTKHWQGTQTATFWIHGGARQNARQIMEW